ncbi:hypothetical protein BG000_006608, partial [Podila horticola]
MEDNLLLSWLKKNRLTPATPTAAAARDEQIVQLARLVNSKLGDTFDRTSTVLHFDGQHTVQKAKAHSQRAAIFQRNRRQALEAIAHARSRIIHLEQKGTPTSKTDIK